MSGKIYANRKYSFTQVNNKVLRDPFLSGLAVGIYSYLISHDPESFNITKKNVEARFSEGRVAFSKAWQQLVDAGWIKSKRVKGVDGKYGEWQHIVYDDNDRVVFNKSTGLACQIDVTDITYSESQDSEVQNSESQKTSVHKNNKLKNTNSKNNKHKDTAKASLSSDDDPQPQTDSKKTVTKKSIPYQTIVELFNSILATKGLPSVKLLNDKRKKSIARCWKSSEKCQSIEFWESYFNHTANSPFLMGTEKEWSATFDWLTNPSNLIKVVEGNYHKGIANGN